LWKKFGGNVSATVDALAVTPIGHKLTPELERTLFTVCLLEREQVCPIARFNAGAFDGPAQIS
jgi:hypothetical protein